MKPNFSLQDKTNFQTDGFISIFRRTCAGAHNRRLGGIGYTSGDVAHGVSI